MNVRTEIPPELVEAYGATLFFCRVACLGGRLRTLI